jgi:Family of unknown function (DUF6065)
MELIACQVSDRSHFNITPASIARNWMDMTSEGVAKRCLPMLIANQSGWFISMNCRVDAVWNGKDGPKDVTIRVHDHSASNFVTAHFGYGIVTFSLPFLFRTAKGYNLLARGPANMPKHGISALEGMVESDWSTATFTMNWKFTTPGLAVTFMPGEPICMIVPQKRGDLELFVPEHKPIADLPEVEAPYAAWAASRAGFIQDIHERKEEVMKAGWQKHYFKGENTTGEQTDQHQTRLKIRPFAEKE